MLLQLLYILCCYSAIISMATPSSSFNRIQHLYHHNEVTETDEMWQQPMMEDVMPFTPLTGSVNDYTNELPLLDNMQYNMWSPSQFDLTEQVSSSSPDHEAAQRPFCQQQDFLEMAGASKDSIGSEYLYYLYGENWHALSYSIYEEYPMALKRQKRIITADEAKQHVQVAINDTLHEKLMFGRPRERLYAANHIYRRATGNIRRTSCH